MSFTQPPAPPAENAPIPSRRTDAQEEFDSKTDVYMVWLASFRNWLAQFLGWCTTMFTELTQAVAYMEGRVSAADVAASKASTSANLAAATANFKGAWSSLAGAIAIPASVFHAGKHWQLLSNLPNVAAVEPGTNPAVWTPLIADAVRENVDIGNANLNAVLTTGFYSFGAAPVNGPANMNSSQLIVSRGGDSLLQIAVGKTSGSIFVRAASAVTTAPVFTPWARVATHSEAVVALNGGPMDCVLGNYFTETVSAARTLAFTNIPATGAYACTLEINHVAGAITLPAGSVWVNGLAPTLQTGKRHLLYFQRAQTGSGGWIVSALPGSAA